MDEPITTTDQIDALPLGSVLIQLREARIVLELFASQPTVAQVKAEALQGVTYDTAFVRRCATDETYNGELLSARDFDRWLAQVKAEAWGEGYVAACDR